MGYRLAMILSGGIALIWTDPTQGGGWNWPEVYRFMAALMVGAAVLSALALPAAADARRSTPRAARHDLLGFWRVLAAVAVGYLAQRPLRRRRWRMRCSARCSKARTLTATLQTALGRTCWRCCWASASRCRWPPGRRAGRASRRCSAACAATSASPARRPSCCFIVLYKLGDAFAGSLMTPFLLKSMAFSPAEVGVVNKVIGLWLTIGGALLGGALMLRLGLWRSLLLFGVLQMASNLGFWWLAVSGKGADAGPGAAGLRLGLRRSWPQPTPVDGGLLMVIAFENLSGGMGTAAFVAFLMSLCNQRFTATQFALLSAFASVGRVWVGPLAGVLAEIDRLADLLHRQHRAGAAGAVDAVVAARASVRALEVDPATAGVSRRLRLDVGQPHC